MSKFTPIQLPLPIENITIEIPLTRGCIAIIDAIDADLTQHKWSTQGAKYLYAFSWNVGKLHRVIMERVLNRLMGSDEWVDHINGNGLDNRRENLRLATNTQNQHNAKRRSDNTSGYKGVTFDRKKEKWMAQIQVNKKRIRLGFFDSKESAYEAYCKAARQHYGEFARFE